MQYGTKIVCDTFCVSVIEPIDVYSKEFSTSLEKLLQELFEACTVYAESKVTNYIPGTASLRLLIMYAYNEWCEASEYINKKKIKFAKPMKGCFELDDRGYIGAIISIPKDELGPLAPIVEEYIEEENIKHPDYLKPDDVKGTNKQPEIRLTRSQLSEIVPVDKLQEKQLLSAYFDTYRELQIYRGMHDYDDKVAKDFAVRMELITRRLIESSGELEKK